MSIETDIHKFTKDQRATLRKVEKICGSQLVEHAWDITAEEDKEDPLKFVFGVALIYLVESKRPIDSELFEEIISYFANGDFLAVNEIIRGQRYDKALTLITAKKMREVDTLQPTLHQETLSW